MKRLIVAGMITTLLAPAGALFAQTEETGVQLFATAEEIAPASEGRHTVVNGETLWDLAGRYYGDPFQWGRIYSANLDKVANPDRIYPNEEISIPELAGTEKSGTDIASEADTISGADDTSVTGPVVAAEGSLLSPGEGDALSRNDLSLLSEEIPKDQQEWTGNTPKIVPGNWRGDGVIVAKLCDDSDSMAGGLTEPGDRVLIKTITPAAFRPGDMLGAYMKGAAAYDTRTGMELGVKLQRTGTLKVISVSGKKIIAGVLNAETSVDQGQLIAR